MWFDIYRTTTGRCKKAQCPVVGAERLRDKRVINIFTIRQILTLSDRAGAELIINTTDDDKNPSIEIYDHWRE